MIERERDIAPIIDLPRSTAQKVTTTVRAQRSIYVGLLPACNSAYPAGEDVQAWLAFAHAGRWKDAWEQLVTANPLPAVHGRVRYHPCESSCVRKEVDGAVSIHVAGSTSSGAAEPGVAK